MEKLLRISVVIFMALTILSFTACKEDGGNTQSQTSYTVTFDKNHDDTEGFTEANPKTKTVKAKSSVGTLPEEPTRSDPDWKFSGWFINADPKNTGAQFTATTPVNANITVYAKWMKTGDVQNITVSFDKNYDSEDWSNSNPKIEEIVVSFTSPETYATLGADMPENPERESEGAAGAWTFTGWYTDAADNQGTLFTSESQVTVNITVYAHWHFLAEGKVLITFADGHDDESGFESADPPALEIDEETAIGAGNMPQPPKRNGYTFVGWKYEVKGSMIDFDETIVVTESITVFAQWEPITFTVTFDKNHNDTDTAPEIKVVVFPATTVGTLPEPPPRIYYQSTEWHTEDGNPFTATTVVDDDITVYAQWTPKTLGGTASITGTYRIGGTLTAVTSAIVPQLKPADDFKYQWQAGGEDIHGAYDSTYTIEGHNAGKVITCEITHEIMAGSITATGQAVPFNIQIEIEQEGKDATDNVTLASEFDLIGAKIGLNYTLAKSKINNRLEFTGVTLDPNGADTNIVTASGGPGEAVTGTKNYTVAATDDLNVDGIIVITAVFFHTDLIMETLAFADHQGVSKTYGDAAFSHPLAANGQGNPANVNPIVYSSSDETVATVDNTGLVTILKAGSTDIRATKAPDTVYSGDTAQYELVVNPKHITIAGGLTVQTKKFDNTTAAVIEGTAVFADGNVINGDTIGFTPKDAVFLEAHVGSNIDVHYNGDLTGAHAANYVIADNGWLELSGNIIQADGYTLQTIPTANVITPTGFTVNAISPPSPAYLGQNDLVVQYNYGTTDSEQTGTWQSGLSFTGLNMNTDYYIFARLNGNTNVSEGTPVVSAAIKTQNVVVTLNKTTTALYVSTVANTPAGRVVETLTATVEIGGVVDPGHAITWASSTPAAATISNGVINAVGRASGSETSTITARSTAYNAASAVCVVTVTFAATPAKVAVNLPVIDGLNGWYAAGNNTDDVIRQTSPFPYNAPANSWSGIYHYMPWSDGNTGGSASISQCVFDTEDKAEGESSYKMTFALSSGSAERNAMYGIEFDSIPFADVNNYDLLTFKTKATVAGMYELKVVAAGGDKIINFTAGTGWGQVTVQLPEFTGNITTFQFKTYNKTGFANASTGNRNGSLWVDDIRLATFADITDMNLTGTYIDRGEYHEDKDGGGHGGQWGGEWYQYWAWRFYKEQLGWKRYFVANNDRMLTTIHNSGQTQSGTSDYPYVGTERFSGYTENGEGPDTVIEAVGLNKPDTYVSALNLNEAWESWGSNIAFVRFGTTETATSTTPVKITNVIAGKNHMVNIILRSQNTNMVMLVKLNDNPAVAIPIRGCGSHWSCTFDKQLTLGPFIGNGEDVIQVSGSVGGEWFNIQYIDIKDTPEN